MNFERWSFEVFRSDNCYVYFLTYSDYSTIDQWNSELSGDSLGEQEPRMLMVNKFAGIPTLLIKSAFQNRNELI